MNFSQLQEITGGHVIQSFRDRTITELLIDSRKAIPNEHVLFFAIKGDRHDGHAFLKEIYALGIRQFVVEKDIPAGELKEANIIKVDSSVRALQDIVSFHRRQFSIPVIGVTGSNGKTIVKEWLYQLLSPDQAVIKNPGSYNSQIGVPLSVWQLQPYHTLAIFEAGISQTGEMRKLERIIQPTIGVFTTIGTAHDEGFSNLHEKIEEKLLLFSKTEVLIYNQDQQDIHALVKKHNLSGLGWGFSDDAAIRVQQVNNSFRLTKGNLEFSITLPFIDKASVENCFHCIAIMLYLKYSPDVIISRVQQLRSISMRLELKEGINHTQLIDDSYNNDLAGLQISLDFLASQHQKNKRCVILSDILQSGLPEEVLVDKIASAIHRSGVDRFIGIGPILTAHQHKFNIPATFFNTVSEFLKADVHTKFHDEIILIKGARTFQFEQIVNRLQRKVHGTVMEIDLGAFVHNLNYFRSKLKPKTKLMVMVKAFAYGSGSIEIANVLQYHKVDYLGVAYADEGVELRKNNITIPIMVMNPSEDSFDQLLMYNLEPEVYSFKILNALIEYLKGKPCRVHVKFDTGMHRLGFDEADLASLMRLLKDHTNLRVASVFSHLAGADDERFDAFSNEQASKFLHWADQLTASLTYKPLYHILNSAGILRLSDWHLDMVRLGIGIYGIDPTGREGNLRTVASLKTVISQIKSIKKGDTVGYSRSGKAEKDTTIATLAIGYADGFSRAFGKGVGAVMINGKRAPVIGNVCMDMTMVDITGIDAAEGDEAIIFGGALPIEELAQKIGTIPYEILTNTSDRVKRVFTAESM